VALSSFAGTSLHPRRNMPEEVWQYHLEARVDTAAEILDEYQEHLHEVGYRQRWDLIPPERLARVWTDYQRLGWVRDEKGVDQIAGIVIKNINKIEANTILCGHEWMDALEYAQDILQKSLPPNYLELIEEFFEDEKGAWRISDYALKDLTEAAVALRAAQTAEEKLQLIDLVLNIVHPRSDLSRWFVDGGKRALTQLYGKAIRSKAA
jgi:hypothetical protein